MLRPVLVACLVSACGASREQPDAGVVVSVDAPRTCPLHDDFSGTTFALQWVFFDDPEVELRQQDALHISIPANTEYVGAAIRLRDPYSLPLGGTVDIEVVKAMTGTSGKIVAELSLFKDQQYDRSFAMSIVGSTFKILQSYTGTYDTYVQRPFDPVANRWWRIENGPLESEVTFWTSPDGRTWSKERTAHAFSTMTDLRVQLQAYSMDLGDPAPAQVIFDNFKLCDGP
jgi:hypothetical protein